MRCRPSRYRLPTGGACAGPKRIGAGAAHRVPIGNAEAEVILHLLAEHHFVFVIKTERQRIVALGAFELNFADFRKCCHGSLRKNPCKERVFCHTRSISEFSSL